MDTPNAMKYHARAIAEADAQIAQLNTDLWQQDATERMRREMARNLACIRRAGASGALGVLLDLHLEHAEEHGPVIADGKDLLAEADVIAAVRDADWGDGKYWRYVTKGGALSLAAWTRSTAEFKALQERADSDPEADVLTPVQERRLSQLDELLNS